MMSAQQCLRVLDVVEQAGCAAWVAGGWGVDALVGRQTREHRDLDLAVEAGSLGPAVAGLARLGYAVETDWLPVRIELGAPGLGWVDVHPVVIDAVGDGVQQGPDGTCFLYPAQCFVTGRIGGCVIGCLSVQQQIAFHGGYLPRAVDVADLALLRALAQRGCPDR